MHKTSRNLKKYVQKLMHPGQVFFKPMDLFSVGIMSVEFYDHGIFFAMVEEPWFDKEVSSNRSYHIKACLLPLSSK